VGSVSLFFKGRDDPVLKKLLFITTSFMTAACTTTKELPPLDKVASVDLKRFMGDWYVIANIPTFVEKGAHNAIEHYDLKDDGTVAIRFTYYKDAFDGPLKTYNMTGKMVSGTNNAEWTVSPFWPLSFPYYTVELDPDYSWVVVATPNRGYLWIMARKPQMDEALLKAITDRMIARGFKASEIERVPQKWP
jgi:apolipoprotein D and lipocalin family protein